MPLHISSICAHHQEVKIVLHSIWYHHTYRWPSRDGSNGSVKNKIMYFITYYMFVSKRIQFSA